MFYIDLTQSVLISYLMGKVLDYMTSVITAVYTEWGALWRLVLILFFVQGLGYQTTIRNVTLN